MKLPVTIDPRYHDAVLLDLDGALTSEAPLFGPTVDLARKLQSIGVATAAYSSNGQCRQALKAAGIDDLFGVCIDGMEGDRGTAEKPNPAVLLEAARRIGARPQRCVVVENSAAGVAAGRAGGFALVVGIDGTGVADELTRHGADVVLAGLADIAVRTGDRRISELPNALASYGQLIGITSARESMLFLDYDGTLSPIVSDPAAARLVEGADEALELVSKVCPVAILSGRDLADVSARVGTPGVWYAGSHGFELTSPDGAYHCNDAAAVFVPVLEEAAAELNKTLAQIAGVRVEHKRFAVAVHYREVAPEHVSEIVSATHQLGARRGLRVTSGRMLVELRPDLDWDKGTTLAWIRDRIDPSGSLLPIYIGDDLTDEDAFDAVRFDGIGIVVGHDEDGDRKTAANFTLQSPEQVREFIQRGSRWLAYKHQVSGEAWDYVFDGYDPQNEKLREALCTVGNGYFATRGAAPESKAGQVHYPGTYAAGVYNRLVDNVSGTEIDNESLVNLPNWLALTFRVDHGDWFDIDAVTVLSYRQTLDLRGAVLTRQVRFRDHAGRTSSLTQRRFVAMHLPHAGALETTVVAEDWSGTIEFRSTVDGNVTNSLVERYRDLANEHLDSADTQELSNNSVLLTMQTNQSRIPIAMAARNTVWRDGEPVPAAFALFDQGAEIGHDIAVHLSAGDAVTLEKVVTVYTGRDVAISEPGVNAQRWVTRLGRFDELLDGHRTAWTHLWERLSIDFDDFTDELRILRLHLLHLLQTVSLNTADLDAGVPARGLHGEAYRGHIFWDELFIFPVLNLRAPMITRSLLGYRYRRLPEARHAARAAGHSGAMFPWQSGSDGREESQRLHLNPRSGRWNPDASARAHHIGIAVAYSAWKFYQVTGDLAYLIDYGAELIAEVARFFVSLASYDEDRERFGIKGVIGPDEFHSGYPEAPYDGIDNNAYTNVMAVWVIMRAIDALNLLPLPNRLDLLEALGLHNEELAHWDDVSRRMYVPFHDGVISQFEGYGDLADLDWDRLRRQYGNIQRLDRILEAENDDVNRYKASKQADALMLLYLLSADELREILDRLGYRFLPEQVPKMVDYYLARTSHGSTLSGVVHTWVLARANRNRALEFFQQALKSDVSDIQGGTTSEGIHLAAMAGTVDLMQRCFTGLETRSNRIILSPYWPESLGVLAIPIHYRGLHLHLRVSGKGVIISVDPRDAAGIEVECRGQVVQLMPGTTVRFPG
ncbi:MULTISPECIES: trehalose-phosphatase [Mycolicibacterium]|uniref:trehalose-phosphatase n=1 Tax=Mycolicibacterium TaxID=1866885 RepID=UPI000569A6A9|nr:MULTISPECIES: trehalose-phosphatase [Mycolicibacterium]QZY44681.1 trehalose-phosphatase [Mycolicibacterium austroafricanum]UJL28316.1 trehalose-phosphatase [Mycolicibacterium vanbaalenii]WND55011.1 trehalose-phosphatase [Mycolicibacterium vanbaalenii]